ncbi:MAG: hypothetical protein QG641_1932 [Candidatus Poribacteria bacterium]|nr:hypothetical protein [Candidatus Poribacteria bacterium]
MEAKVKFNKKLLWDYDISEGDLEKEDALILYVSRVLNNGTKAEVSEIPLEFIKKHLDELNLSSRVRNFWEWYLRNKD